MEATLCFNIEGIELYLEQVLVDYNDIPIFFLCTGEREQYLALCYDINELNYIIVKVSMEDVYNLLHSKITMRNIILKQKFYWSVLSGEEISLDRVLKNDISELDLSILPCEGAYFTILTKEIETFTNQFDSKYFENKYLYKNSYNYQFTDVLEMNTDELDIGLELTLGEGKVNNEFNGSKICYDDQFENNIFLPPCMNTTFILDESIDFEVNNKIYVLAA